MPDNDDRENEAPGRKAASGVSRVNDELAAGYDEDFESWWWRVEIGVWVVLSICILAGLLGLTGRGVLAKHLRRTSDAGLEVKYERVARYKTPTIIQIRLSPAVFQGKTAYLWVNRAIIEDMGTQRIIPQPLTSYPGENGIGYVFPVQEAGQPLFISLAEEPSRPGIFEQEMKTDPKHDLFMRVVIFP